MLYLSFLAFAVLVVVAPGPDFAVVLKNSIAAGRRSGFAAAAGVASSNVVHGTAAALGVSALLTASQTLFTTVRWIGIAYLCYLGVQALRAAWRGGYASPSHAGHVPGGVLRGWSQGFLSNLTNPKVLAFYLSVLPQFLGGGEVTLGAVLLLAYSHAALSLTWLVLIVALLHRVRDWVGRSAVRRAIDTGTGTALLGFAAALGRPDAERAVRSLVAEAA
ncbi:threonine/homoserine/homoserine lactone efflux protein [Murinocardiopsis flavida]|uniref:Threonine/homoserine/homoserine lactone efflux protein n=1 Tax=Murinocardiopsis flavida TaxID=645275 RepID=A0A2P8DFM4_9ACTN|nr:LysE family translocator [Murinocardiopsis flavida]PSK95987.1 threonine/homoserine/homoserine lactone efflux protein [Murinocardiopsis flavida]